MHPWLKAGLKIFVCLVGMIVFGGAAGLLVKWLSEPWVIQSWWQAGAPVWPVDLDYPFWSSMVYGGMYSIALWGTTLGMRKVAYHFIPLTHWKKVIWHFAIITVCVVAAFQVAYEMNGLICLLLEGKPPVSLPVELIAVISLGTTLVINTALYSADFYRGMRKAERTALVAELRALRAQINPHFLFNTLNSIAALVHSRPNEAEHVVEELAELFRYTLRASQNPTVSLAEDLKAANRYLDIEKARFRDRMTVTEKVEPLALDALVPSLLVQPLVENAVKHGVSKTEDNCGVLIEITRQDDEVLLRVRDTGPGFASTEPQEIFSRGTGLANVRDRLHLHFGSQSTFKILPDGVELRFPCRIGAERHTDPFPEVYHRSRA